MEKDKPLDWSLYNPTLPAKPLDCQTSLIQGELYIIDVSQAVDLDHPRALDFLREDAAHVNTFFRRAGIATLTTRELFEFIVDPNINAGNIDTAIDRLSQLAATRDPQSSHEDQTADNVRVYHRCLEARVTCCVWSTSVAALKGVADTSLKPDLAWISDRSLPRHTFHEP